MESKLFFFIIISYKSRIRIVTVVQISPISIILCHTRQWKYPNLSISFKSSRATVQTSKIPDSTQKQNEHQSKA